MEVRQVVPRDAIPSVDDPTFGTEYEGSPDDRVIVVDPGSVSTASERPRAYPVRYLHYHEIVNDTLPAGGDGLPIAVTWCPLCGSAVVYDRRVRERELTFGVSGKLADDDLVMYDRETESEWKQSLGECIAGPLEGESLSMLAMTVTDWQAFRDANPAGLVLQPPGGASEAASDDDDPERIDYDDQPYAEYFDSDGFGLAAHRGSAEGRQWTRDDIDPKTVVLGIVRDDEALGFPLPEVEEAGGAVTTTVGSTPVVVFATSDGIHAFENEGYHFDRVDNRRFRADETTWDGVSGSSEDGRRLARLPARRLFAFTWQDDYGADAFYSCK